MRGEACSAQRVCVSDVAHCVESGLMSVPQCCTATDCATVYRTQRRTVFTVHLVQQFVRVLWYRHLR